MTELSISKEQESNIQELETKSVSWIVEDNSKRVDSLDIIKQVKQYRNNVINFFAEPKKKAHEAWKAIIAREQVFTNRLDNIERNIKTAILDFDREQEKIRQEEQRKAEEKARKERERLEKKATEMKTEAKQEEYQERAASVVAEVVEEKSEKVDGESYQTVWKFTVIDKDKVPDQYKIVDEVMVGKIVKATKGAMDIPGIKIYAEKILKVRV